MCLVCDRIKLIQEGKNPFFVKELGTGDIHLHWHMFPRAEHDTPDPGPVWWLPREEMYSPENIPSPKELEELKSRLRTALDILLEVE